MEKNAEKTIPIEKKSLIFSVGVKHQKHYFSPYILTKTGHGRINNIWGFAKFVICSWIFFLFRMEKCYKTPTILIKTCKIRINTMVATLLYLLTYLLTYLPVWNMVFGGK